MNKVMNKVKQLFDLNGDGTVDMQDIYFIITEIMSEQEKLKIHGSDRKDNTMKTVRNIIGVHLYDRFQPMIDAAIEFILTVANNKKLLKHLKKNCKCCISK
jgi:hypothetical protein